MKTVGIIGAGKLGTVLARLALNAGYHVYIAGSGSPDKIALSMKFIAPGALPLTVSDVIQHSEIIILALPLSKFSKLPAEEFTHKLVIDAMNYWWEIDGDDPTLKSGENSSSEMVQAFLANASVVKALSHMGYHHLLDESRVSSDNRRKAIAIAGDSVSDNSKVAKLVDDLGFDPIIIGPLKNGKILEPGSPLFGANITKSEMTRIVERLLKLSD